MLESPTRSDKKFYWMFCIVLRNSLTIKSLFLGSVIFRNDMFFISHLFLFFFSNTVWNMILNMGLNTVLNTVLNTILNTVLNTILNMVLKLRLSRRSCRISLKSYTSFSFYIATFFKTRLRFYSKVFFHSCKRFKLQQN